MPRYENESSRIAPAEDPFDDDVQAELDAVLKGRPPLLLFRVLARDRRLFRRFFAGGLLDRGHLTLHEREVVIDRVTARCAAEYEWGVHVATFATRAGLDDRQLSSLVHGDAADPCWDARDRVLLRTCDALHATCDIDDELWADVHAEFSDEAILEIVLLAGFYRTVSYLVRGLRLSPEPGAAGFADV